MVTMLIIGIGAAVAVSSSRGYGAQAQNYSKVIYAEVNRVRQSAVSGGRCYHMAFASTGVSTTWADVDTNGCNSTCTTCTGTWVKERTYAVPNGVAIYSAQNTDCSSATNPTTVSTSTLTLTFASDGTSDSSACVFVGTTKPPTQKIEGKSAFGITASTGKSSGSVWSSTD